MCRQSICIRARLEGPRFATGASTAGTFSEKKSPIHKPGYLDWFLQSSITTFDIGPVIPNQEKKQEPQATATAHPKGCKCRRSKCRKKCEQFIMHRYYHCAFCMLLFDIQNCQQSPAQLMCEFYVVACRLRMLSNGGHVFAEVRMHELWEQSDRFSQESTSSCGNDQVFSMWLTSLTSHLYWLATLFLWHPVLSISFPNSMLRLSTTYTTAAALEKPWMHILQWIVTISSRIPWFQFFQKCCLIFCLYPQEWLHTHSSTRTWLHFARARAHTHSYILLVHTHTHTHTHLHTPRAQACTNTHAVLARNCSWELNFAATSYKVT